MASHDWIALGRKALKLSKKITDIQALKKALGCTYAAEAHHLVNLGQKCASIDTHQLTASELLLLQCLAAVHRAELSRGNISSPKSKWVSARARKSYGWAAATAAKRLGTHRKGEDQRWRGTGLNMVYASRNGHMWMEPAGWAVIHALEAANIDAPGAA